MNTKKLQKFIEQKIFECDTNLSDSIMDGIHKAYAFLVDKATKSNGYVQTQILADDSLKESLKNEAIPLLQFLNNKLKIALLTGNNVIQGKMEQRESDPNIEILENENFDTIINEETNNDCESNELVEDIFELHHCEPNCPKGDEEGCEDEGSEIQGFDL